MNWSGYAATSAKKFTSVPSTFVQPAITCPGVKNEWTSNWVGLDGFNDATVEQDGTIAHCGRPLDDPLGGGPLAGSTGRGGRGRLPGGEVGGW